MKQTLRSPGTHRWMTWWVDGNPWMAGATVANEPSICSVYNCSNSIFNIFGMAYVLRARRKLVLCSAARMIGRIRSRPRLRYAATVQLGSGP